MADLSATEKEDLQAQKAFGDGFDGTALPDKAATPAPEPKPAPPAAEPPKAEEPKPAAPETVSLTKDDFARLDAAAMKTVSLEQQLSKAFGTMGNLKQAIDKLQASTPSGQEINPLKFAKVREQFPEIADLLEGDFEEAVKSLRGTGPSTDAPQTFDAAAIVATALQEAAVKREIEALEDAYPDWREIVGAVSDGQFDPKHPFRSWLETQPEAYRQKVNTTNNAAIIERAIDKFKAATKATENKTPAQSAPRDTARRDRIRASTQPKGDGGTPPAPKTEQDHFREGFASG